MLAISCFTRNARVGGIGVASDDNLSYDPNFFFTDTSGSATVVNFRKDQRLFAQGDPADSVFRVQEGKVKVTVVSEQGKEAVIAILGAGELCGEGCLGGQTVRMASVVALTDGIAARVEKAVVVRMIHSDQKFSEAFTAHLLARNIRVEADLVDHLFNSSEKRLARLLLILANFGKDGKPEPIIPPITQETLAEMIGTTRSRVSFFMNKFRQMGFIDYNGRLEVHSSLLSIVLHDEQSKDDI
jgi:CRP/FNR family cyclic AMP-dependent transcriptional regulator